MSRIANWGELSERERAVALKRLAARNRERVAALQAKADAAVAASAAGPGEAAAVANSAPASDAGGS